MGKQKSQAEIEAQIKQCDECVVALNELMDDWTDLNARTRATFKGSESKWNSRLNNALNGSDIHIAELKKELEEQISKLQNELKKI